MRARSRARSALRQTINRSPGKSGEVTAAMSRSSNSDICRYPPPTRPCSAGARSAVIQSNPAGRKSSSMRAWVIMPRSPTSTTWFEGEPLLQLGDLIGHRFGIAGIALEHLDRDRAAVGGAQQAVDDLRLALLAVAVVAALGQRTAAAFDIARRDVVEHQRPALQMALGERGLDRALALMQPIQRGVEFALVDFA